MTNTAAYDDLHTQALPFRTDWSITTAEWHWLAALTRRLGARRVLEFGPGYSTLAFMAGGAERIETHEGDSVRVSLGPLSKACEEWFLKYNVRLRFCNMAHLQLDPQGFRECADLVFVDAPPGSACYYSRLNTLLCALSIDGVKAVVLHDSNREGERRTLAVISKLGVEVIEQRTEDQGMIVLRRAATSC